MLPGSSVGCGQVTAPAFGSAIATEVAVTVPVSCTRNDQTTVSPRSVRPSPLTSVTAADLVSCRPELWSTGVSAVDGFEVTGWPCGSTAAAVAVLVTTPASTSVWLIDVHSDRAGHARPRGQRTGRAGHRAGRRVAHRDRGQRRGAGVLDPQPPGDLVAEVDLEVAVDVGVGRGLGQLHGRGLRDRRGRRGRARGDRVAAGVLAAGRRRVGDRARVDIGLGHDVGTRRTGGGGARSRGCRGTRDGAGGRVVHRDVGDSGRADVRDQERPGDPVAEVGPAVSRRHRSRRRSC